MDRVEPADDLRHQRAYLTIVEMGDIIPRNLASISIDDADVRIITGMGDRDYASMKGFEARIADAHRRQRFNHLGSNALFIVPVHRPTIAANLPHNRPEPILLRRCSARAMALPRH